MQDNTSNAFLLFQKRPTSPPVPPSGLPAVVVNRSSSIGTSQLLHGIAPVDKDFVNSTAKAAAKALLDDVPSLVMNQHMVGFGSTHLAVGLVSAQFTAADGTGITTYHPETHGHPIGAGTANHTWSQRAGTFAINNNRLTNTATGHITIAPEQFALNDTTGEERWFEVDVNMGTVGTAHAKGIIFRWTDTQNYIYARFRVSSGGFYSITIWRATANVHTDITVGTNTVTGTAGQTFRLRVIVSGDNFTAQVYNTTTLALIREVTATSTQGSTSNVFGLNTLEGVVADSWFDNYLAIHYHWRVFDARIDELWDVRTSQPTAKFMLELFNWPTWLCNGVSAEHIWNASFNLYDGIYQTDSSTGYLETWAYAPLAAHFEQVVRHCIARGRTPDYLSNGQEQKKNFNSSLNWGGGTGAWDYNRYATQHTAAYNRLHPLGIPFGGPYHPLSRTWSSSANGGAGGMNARCTKEMTEILTQVNAAGAGFDFVSFDFSGIGFDENIYPDQSATAVPSGADLTAWLQLQIDRTIRFRRMVEHVQALCVSILGSTRPIFVMETYPMAWAGYTTPPATGFEEKDNNRFYGQTHEYQDMAMTYAFIQMMLGGASLAINWAPEGESTVPFYSGDRNSWYSDTATSGGGIAFARMQSVRDLSQNFGPGTTLYATTAPAGLVAVASATKTFVLNTTGSPYAVTIEGADRTLAAYDTQIYNKSP